MVKLIAVLSGVFIVIFDGLSQDILLADSLFESRKYTEANDIYNEIYESGDASPAMLLKMAFIQEGLENQANALFFLNQYYSLTANKRALEKMREIAAKHELQGYEYSDMEFFLHLLSRYRPWLLGFLYAVSIMLIGIMYMNTRKKRTLHGPIAFQVVVIILLIGITNNFFQKPKGIINSDGTLLMSGPSAGADPLEVIGRGHKVSILEVTEAWVKIDWGHQEGYIRNNRIRPI